MKTITTFQNKKILVLGLAKSGESAARLLHQLGAIVTVNDSKPFEENTAAQSLLEEGITVITGKHPLELLDEEFFLMVKNPGIPYSNPMVEKAIEKELPIITEVELAYLISEAPIIGITGSNGKTTTTTMISAVLNASGQKSLLSGNIGFPASEVAQKAQPQDILTMELSSFQLMGVDAFHPHIAVITNLMPTHIDYHGDFDHYVAAKWNIQNNMTSKDVLVLNYNQEISKELAKQTKAKVLPFSSQEEVDGAYLKDHILYYKNEVVMKADEIGVPGLHNIENALATIAVVKQYGVANEVIKETLSQFSGVKHRLQYIGSSRSVRFYNDSKSTNILATQKALSGFKNAQTILIAGGLDRGNEFDALVPDIRGLKQMILLGESKNKLKKAALKAEVATTEVSSVSEAVQVAYDLANEGDTILFSPANASWDMYPNFEIRGDDFISAFESIRKEKDE